jgi:DNA-directed RNA polymerase specialized sigma24 family protein
MLSSLDLTELLSNPTRRRRRPKSQTLKQPNVRLRPEQVADLLVQYKGGTSLAALASTFGIHESTVKAHIRRAGATMRPVRKITAEQVREMVQLYERDGWSTAQIGQHLGCDKKTVNRHLKQVGIQLKPPGRPTR